MLGHTNNPYKYQDGQVTPILQIPRRAGNSHLQLHATTTAAGDAGEDDGNKDAKGENDARMAVLVLLTTASLGKPIKVLVSYFLCTLQLLLLPFPPLLPQQPCYYHWRELPQVSFLSRQTFCWDRHTFVITKEVFCRNRSMLVTKKLLRQTKWCLLRQISVTAKVLSPQTCVCRDKSFFVTTKLLLLQPYFSCDKRCVLSRQKRYLCLLPPMTCYSISHTLADRVYIHVSPHTYIFVFLLNHHLNLP